MPLDIQEFNFMEIIKKILEGNLDKNHFFNELYSNGKMEELLKDVHDIPPYTNNCSLFEYLKAIRKMHLTGDISLLTDKRQKSSYQK